jgi:uncharacterized membrane protein YdjX (TVP38/TMEM64 family)
LSYFICRKFFKGIFERKLRKYAKLEKFMKLMDNITYDQLVVLVAIPFTPAYLVNIASGISKMSYKKYFWQCF